MKNFLSAKAKTILFISVLATVSAVQAQVTSLGTVPDKSESSHVEISIPEQWREAVVRDEGEGTTTFSLDNGDAPPVFLFSVTQIPEQQWIKVRAQSSDIKMIAQKDGMIYYSQKNNKEKIKGADSELYQKIHPHLDELISSIHID